MYVVAQIWFSLQVAEAELQTPVNLFGEREVDNRFN